MRTHFLRGPYDRYLLAAAGTPGNTRGCLVTMTDKQYRSEKWTFELPGTPASVVEQAWQRWQPSTLSEPTTSALAASPVGIADELSKLGRLRDQGLLTEDEFNAQKTKLLGN